MTISNPYKQLLEALNNDQSLAIRGNEQAYQFWLIRDSALKPYLHRELYAKFRGVQLYAHNDFVAIDLECQPANQNFLRGIDGTADYLHGMVMVNAAPRRKVLQPIELDPDLLESIRQKIWEVSN